MATAPRPRTTRDPEELAVRLTAWFDRRLPGATVSGLAVPGSNGMSSESLLFDLEHPDAPVRDCALRLAADPAAYTVFPVYDMARRYRVMALVAEHTDVPVPRVLWLEEDLEPLGAPFLVRARAEGGCHRTSCPTCTRGTGRTPPRTPDAPRWRRSPWPSSPACTTRSR